MGARRNGHVPDTEGAPGLPVTYVEIYDRPRARRDEPFVGFQKFQATRLGGAATAGIPLIDTDLVYQSEPCTLTVISYLFDQMLRHNIIAYSYVEPLVSNDLTAYFARSRANISRGN